MEIDHPKARLGLIIAEQVRRGRRMLTVLDPKTYRVTVLEPWEHAVLVLCDGENSLHEIATTVRDVADDIPAEKDAVRRCIDFLRRQNVLEPPQERRKQETPKEQHDGDRRPQPPPGPRTLADLQNAYHEWHRDPQKQGQLLTGLDPFGTPESIAHVGLEPTVALPDAPTKAAHAVGTVLVVASAPPHPSSATSRPEAPSKTLSPPTSASPRSSGASTAPPSSASSAASASASASASTAAFAGAKAAAGSTARSSSSASLFEEIEALFDELSGPKDLLDASYRGSVYNEEPASMPSSTPASPSRTTPPAPSSPSKAERFRVQAMIGETTGEEEETTLSVLPYAPMAESGGVLQRLRQTVARMSAGATKPGPSATPSPTASMSGPDLHFALQHLQRIEAKMPQSDSIAAFVRALEALRNTRQTSRGSTHEAPTVARPAPQALPTDPRAERRAEPRAESQVSDTLDAILREALSAGFCPQCLSDVEPPRSSRVSRAPVPCPTCGFTLQ